MTNVKVPFTGKTAGDTATLLLAAAEETKQGPSVVQTRSGYFLVPSEVAEKAGVDYDDPEVDSGDDEKAPAKKSTTKKAASKTAAADKE